MLYLRDIVDQISIGDMLVSSYLVDKHQTMLIVLNRPKILDSDEFVMIDFLSDHGIIKGAELGLGRKVWHWIRVK